MMSSSVRRTSDEALCILAWQLPRVAAMADTGLMEACLPPESCSFGRRTISARNITRYFQDMPFPAIQNPTEVVNYTGAVLEASNVDLSRLCLGGVTDGSSLGAIFNHFTGKFDLSPSSQMANKMAEQKEKSYIAAATVADKEVAAYNMVSNQFVQDDFHMPSLVAYDSPELLESSSRRVQTDRPVLNAARNQTTNHAHGTSGERSSSVHTKAQSHVKDRVRKSSYLQLCMQLNDPSPNFGYKPVDLSKNDSGNIWDYSDNEAAAAFSWSTLPNRSLYRRLLVDIGRSSCVIVKEISVDGLKGASLYTLYTNVFDAVTLFHGAEAEIVCRVELAEKSKSKKVPSLLHASSSLKK
ncbi:hypothetical protein Tco_0184036 [Tanacetum coccineum]